MKRRAHRENPANSDPKLAPEILMTVSQAVSSALKGGGKPEDAIAEVAQGAARGAVAVGHALDVTARNTMLGELRGGAASELDALKIIRTASRSFLEGVGESHGDAEAAARGLVSGAVDGTQEAGVDPGQAATTVLQGVLDAADSLGSHAAEEVCDAAGKEYARIARTLHR